MANRGDGVAEFTVDTAAVVKLLVAVTGGALVLDTADATDANDEDDEHQDESHAQSTNDYVQRVTWHVGQRVDRLSHLPLQMDLTASTDPAGRAVTGVAV